VPISVVAAFKKIKALVHNNSTLAMALRTSSKLVSFCRIFFLFKVVFISRPKISSHSYWLAKIHGCYLITFFTLQVVSEDGKRVKRQEPFTEADLQELQVFMDVSVLHVYLYISVGEH
jgi:La-related protein 7